jgi:hypothetical protein
MWDVRETRYTVYGRHGISSIAYWRSQHYGTVLLVVSKSSIIVVYKLEGFSRSLNQLLYLLSLLLIMLLHPWRFLWDSAISFIYFWASFILVSASFVFHSLFVLFFLYSFPFLTFVFFILFTASLRKAHKAPISNFNFDKKLGKVNSHLLYCLCMIFFIIFVLCLFFLF